MALDTPYEGSGEFDWDPDKAQANLRKHQVSFEEAMTAFRDPLAISVPDSLHSNEEDRLLLIGLSDRQRLLVVSHIERDGIRLISARLATTHERRDYEEEPGYAP